MDYLGIDIGGTEVKIGLIMDEGRLCCKKNYAVAFDDYDTPILETVLKSTALFLEENKIDKSMLCGIGVSATGQIHTGTGVVIGTAGHIKNWVGSPIKEAFENIFQVPVLVRNDANCVALGELWRGQAKNCKNAVIVTIGTGIGGGVIINSKLLEGAVGLAGELGHFSICRDGILCTCGNRGCYERYASTTALVRRVREEYAKLGICDVRPEDIDGKLIFEWVKHGNQGIAAIVDEWIDYIADGLVGLTHIFNPEAIILGGGVSAQEELLVSKVRKNVLRRVMPRFGEGLRIEAAALGNDAGMVGAVAGFLL